MNALVELYQHQLLVFVLVLTRVSGLIAMAPVLGTREVPLRAKALLAVAVAVLVAPLHFHVAFELPENELGLIVLLGRELLLGLALGLGTMILFAGLQLVGQILGQMSGMQLADVFDPTFDASVPVYGRLLDQTTLAAFLCVGGHRQLFAALLDTFSALPVGALRLPGGYLEVATEVLAQSFVLGVRAAAPAMLALLMAVLIMGFITRTLPQLNVNTVGFGVNSLLLPLMLVISLGAIAWIFQEHSRTMQEILAQWLDHAH